MRDRKLSGPRPTLASCWSDLATGTIGPGSLMNVAPKTALRAKAAIVPRPRQVSKRRRPRSASGNRARLRRSRGGLHHLYIWCGDRVCQQRASDGETVLRNYFTEGFTDGVDSYLHTRDHLGSVWQVIEDDGEGLVSSVTYGPWGETGLAGEGPHSHFGYTGHFRRTDPREGVLSYYRLYDARLGRWLSRDPLEEVDGPNLHGYVANDPIRLVDPFGLSAVCKDPDPDPTGNWVCIVYSSIRSWPGRYCPGAHSGMVGGVGVSKLRAVACYLARAAASRAARSHDSACYLPSGDGCRCYRH